MLCESIDDAPVPLLLPFRLCDRGLLLSPHPTIVEVLEYCDWGELEVCCCWNRIADSICCDKGQESSRGLLEYSCFTDIRAQKNGSSFTLD